MKVQRDSEVISINKEVHQDDTLSPKLFTTILEINGLVPGYKNRRQIHYLRFPDDMVMFSISTK